MMYPSYINTPFAMAVLDVGGISVVANKKSGSRHSKGKQVTAEKKSPAKPHTIAHASTAMVTMDRRESRERRSGDRRTEHFPVTGERRMLRAADEGRLPAGRSTPQPASAITRPTRSSS